MKMKKPIALLLCVLFFLANVAPVSGLATDDPYYIAINDEFPELNQQTEPIRVSGVTYIPWTIFDRRSTGVDLGVYSSWDVKAKKVSLYFKARVLEFDLESGTAHASDEDKDYNYQAVMRNGLPYLPAVSSCNYFGLSCSFPVTEDAKYQILRLKNGNQILNDTMFMRSVRPILEERLTKPSQSGSGSSKGGGNQSGRGTTGTSSGASSDAPGENTAVYLAIRVDHAKNLDSMLNALTGNRQVKAVFFFPVSRLEECDDLLRELTGHGQRVGLIPSGNSLQAQLDSLNEGNRLLGHILRQKAFFVLSESATEEQRTGLRAEGYLPWSPNVTVSAAGRSDAAIYQSVLDKLKKKTGKVRLLLDDGMKGGTLSSALRQLREDGYDLRVFRETDC